MADPARKKWKKYALRGLAVVALLILIPVVLFVVNGTILASGEVPRAGRFDDVPDTPARTPGEVTAVAYNIAKGWAPRGGLSFHDRATVEGKLRRMADAVRGERPDFLFLSEAMTECTPCPVNQVEFLARECGLPYWAFGENYNFGLPVYRVVGGNAILSRFPLEPVANPSLAGRQLFYVTKNNRRVLFAAADVGGTRVLLGSLHNDSYDIRNNDAQTRQLLEFIGDRPCLLAGDFNAMPTEPPIQRAREAGRFTGAFDGPPTYISGDRRERIDFVFAPKGWEHVETRVIEADASDHRPVVARFRPPR